MSYEDILSGIPPLSKPPSVQMIHSNASTIWVKWDRITKHNFTKKDVPDPNSVTYCLYVQSAFQNILKGDRVSVAPPEGSAANIKRPHEASTSKSRSYFHFANKFDDPIEVFFDESVRRFSGEVLSVNKSGSFDVLYDDGTTEWSVPRFRMKLLPQSLLPPIWSPSRSSSFHDDNKSSADEVSTITSLPSLATSQAEVSIAIKNRLHRKMEKRAKHLQKMSELKKNIDVIETVATVSSLDKLKDKASSSIRSVDSSSSASSSTLPTPISTAKGKRRTDFSSSRTSRSVRSGVRSRRSSSRLGLGRTNTGSSSSIFSELAEDAIDFMDDFDNVSIHSKDSISINSDDSEAHLTPTVPIPSSEW